MFIAALHQLGHGSNLDVHRQMNGYRRRGPYIQWTINQKKRNAFELVLMRWMNLEPTKQSEVSQKEKNKYCILAHVCGIQKDGTDDLACRATKETQT